MVEERGGEPGVSSTSGSADAVDIVVDVGGEIKVDNVHDVGDIKTTGGNVSGNEDPNPANLEGPEGVLTLPLSLVTVNAGSVDVVLPQLVLEAAHREISGYEARKGKREKKKKKKSYTSAPRLVWLKTRMRPSI